jgi:protein-S-isoprenylcysteine O-methyltransferase Ste14
MSPVSTGEGKERKKGHRRGSGILEVIILLVLPLVCHYLIPIRTVIHPPFSYFGAFLMLPGLGLAMWAAKAFREAGTGFQLERGGLVLVTSGPFGFSRNPMYLGLVIWLLGFAVLLGSIVVFIFPILVFLLAQFLLIPIEERRMEQTFGEQFIEYTQRVRRWV